MTFRRNSTHAQRFIKRQLSFLSCLRGSEPFVPRGVGQYLFLSCLRGSELLQQTVNRFCQVGAGLRTIDA